MIFLENALPSWLSPGSEGGPESLKMGGLAESLTGREHCPLAQVFKRSCPSVDHRLSGVSSSEAFPLDVTVLICLMPSFSLPIWILPSTNRCSIGFFVCFCLFPGHLQPRWCFLRCRIPVMAPPPLRMAGPPSLWLPPTSPFPTQAHPLQAWRLSTSNSSAWR